MFKNPMSNSNDPEEIRHRQEHLEREAKVKDEMVGLVKSSDNIILIHWDEEGYGSSTYFLDPSEAITYLEMIKHKILCRMEQDEEEQE